MFDGVKKVWTMLGTFGIVKPIGLLTIGLAGSGTGSAAISGFSSTVTWVLGLLAAVCGAGVGVWTYMWRQTGVRRREVFGRGYIHVPPPEPAPAPVREPEPWTWRAEVLPATPRELDPPRVFIAGEVIDEKV